jgi:hypothetical protein
MASNRKKTNRIRARKAKPNKRNLKADLKRFQKNAEALRETAPREEG